VLHSAAATFRGILSGDLSYFGGPVTSPAVAARLRAAQIGAILHYLPWMMLANASNALVLVAALWSSPDRPWAIAWASVVIAYSGVYGIRSLRRGPTKVEAVSERTIRRAVRNAFLLGCTCHFAPAVGLVDAMRDGVAAGLHRRSVHSRVIDDDVDAARLERGVQPIENDG